MALLLSASIGGTESEVMQMYTIAREHASALSLTLPLPPTGPLEDRMAEGLLFSIDTARNINQALVREHGERVAASFMLSFSALTANTFSVNENLRETMVNNAVQAAHVLNLPIEFVQGVIQSIESSDDDSGFQIYRMMNDLKGRQ
ncbi:MAG: hypothetical protein ABW104_18080 [Candidatus Thiodiazotropha sp. 6PLUC2]|nr:hypothetical protein [Candidatus Thiodiazotropha lotti]MCW4218796.1 hypothetical protein [Candidatus Thiodiazotropha lotti]